MIELVEILNGRQVVTDSLKVAKFFERNHKDVLRKIKAIINQGVVAERNFEPSEYLDQSGRKLPYYLMDKDGFTLLALGFSGEKAHQFKIEYIKAFNKALHIIQQQREFIFRNALGNNALFNLDSVVLHFGEISKITNLPKTKAIAYFRTERKENFYDELGLYNYPLMNNVSLLG